MIHYRALSEQELCRELFQDFIRHQTVTKCWRKENSGWVIKDAPFIDDWTESDYDFLISCLKNTVSSGGFVYAAFSGRSLKGFASVEAGLFGSRHQYLDLTSLHVSEDLRGKGMGQEARGGKIIHFRPLRRGNTGILSKNGMRRRKRNPERAYGRRAL